MKVTAAILTNASEGRYYTEEMISFLVWALLPLCAWVTGEPPLKNVTDIDFENTKVKKICLLAQIDAKIVMNQTLATGGVKSYTVIILHNATTEGSYCNKDYVSQLQLNFAGSTIRMKFKRNVPPTKKDEAKYCDECNYGSWTLDQITYNVLHDGYKIHGTSESDDVKKSAPELSEGIGIRRSFLCDKNDTVISFPIHISEVANITNNHITSKETWSGKISFDMFRVQPFLVVTGHSSALRFADPYLCRDVTVLHVLVILLPLVYFAIFVTFYRTKPRWSKHIAKSKGAKLEKASSCPMEMEESTNILSDEYNTVQLGLTSSVCDGEYINEDCKN